MSEEVYAKKRFLIVDELDAFRFSTKKTLKSLGAKNVDAASNARSVVSAYKNINYDVILCNYDLGSGQNGQELLEELRFKKLLKFTSLFFIISAEVRKDRVMGTLENEPDGYLVKPIKPNELEARINKGLERKEATRAIDEAIDREDYVDAIAECDKCIASPDKYLNVHLKTKAWLLTKSEQWDEAETYHRELLQSLDYTWIRYGMAEIAIKRKNFDEAESMLQAIIEKDPNQVEAMDMLADIYSKQGKNENAQEIIEKAIEVSPNSLLRQKSLAEISVKNKKPEAALEAYKRMANLGDQSVYAKPEHYFEYADFLTNEFKNDGAEDQPWQVKEAFNVVGKVQKRFSLVPQIEQQSKLAEANLNIMIGKEDEAEELLKEATEKAGPKGLDPKTAQIAAKALFNLGKSEEADALLEDAADEVKDDPELMTSIYDQMKRNLSQENLIQAAGLNKQGIKHYESGAVEDAANELREAAKYTPRHISLNLNLIQVLLRLNAKNPDQALIREAEACMHRVRHIPKHHKEYRRFQFLQKKLKAN